MSLILVLPRCCWSPDDWLQVHLPDLFRCCWSLTRPPLLWLQVHLPNLFRPRESEPLRIATRFAPDPAWAATLSKLRQQRATWLGTIN